MGGGSERHFQTHEVPKIYLEYTFLQKLLEDALYHSKRQSARREAGNQETGALRQEQSSPGVMEKGEEEGS